MKYTNLTPHDIVIMPLEGATQTIPAGGIVVRLQETTTSEMVDGVEITVVTLSAPDNLPEPQEGVTPIGSMPLAMGLAAAGWHRPDLMYPFGQVRNGNGRIIGCRGLARLA